MRILIVNGYDNSNLEKFQSFQYYVMKFLAEQKELIDTENEFYVRNRDTIEDFLFEVESSHVRREAALKFDQLDLIFIIGDSFTRPWTPRMIKVLILLRMCLRVKKLLFASGFAMQALVYLSASNIERPINLLNINGGKIADIKKLNVQKIEQNDLFLENTSGDLYSFNYDTSEWVPKTNVGMHQRRAAQEFQSIGKYIVKAPQYKPKPLQQIFKNKNTETIVQIKNQYLNHWAFKELPSRFLVPLLNQWDVHQFQFNNNIKKFILLADSDEGASIIEYPKCLACMFEIDTKYTPTIQILKNFINNAMFNIKTPTNKNANNSIENFHQIVKISTLQDQLKYFQNPKIKQTTLELMQKRSKNGISAQQQSSATVQNTEPSPMLMLMKRSSIAHVGFSLNKNKPINPVQFNAVGKRKIKYRMTASTIKERKQSMEPLEIESDSDKSIQQQSEQRFLGMREIKKLLHPELPKTFLGNDKVWIPGHLSEQKPDPEKKITRVVMPKRQVSNESRTKNNTTNISMEFIKVSRTNSQPHQNFIDFINFSSYIISQFSYYKIQKLNLTLFN